MPEVSDGLTVNAMAKFYAVDRSTVQRLVDKGTLVPINDGKRKLFNVSEAGRLLIESRKEAGFAEGYREGKAAGMQESGVDQDIEYEKWRETRGRADKLELDNLERKRMLAPLESIIQRDRILANLQATLWDSLAVRVKRKRPDVPDELMEAVEEIVTKCRNEYDTLIQERMAELEQAKKDRMELEEGTS